MTVPAPVWLGVDLGTQGVRALAVTDDGEVVGSGEAALASRRDGIRHEQDPADWWRGTTEAVGRALATTDGAEVRGVAVDGTSGTVLLVDADGTPVSPALMYDDGRAVDLVERIDEAGAEVWARLGYRRMQPAWALPKLLWLLEHHRPSPGARAAHQVDVVTRALVGHAVPSDLSNALKTGADQQREEWPLSVMDDLGVTADLLPPLVRPGTPLGVVDARAAAATGLPAGTPVLAGATDGYAGQLAAGALAPGSWSVVLGTTMVFKGVTEDPVDDPGGAVYSHRAPDGRWYPGGASSTGAGVVAERWPADRLDALTREAGDRGTPSDVRYPLARRGERFPFVAPDAAGFDLDEPADDVAAFAATLLGVALVERLCLDVLDARGAATDGRHVTTGGGTRNPWWTQLRADVTRRDLVVPESSGGAFGMAVLAAASCGGDGARDLDEVALRMVRSGAPTVHRPEESARHDASYHRLVDALAGRGWLDAGLADHARGRIPS